MDLIAVDEVLMPRARAQLPAWSADTALLGGGTWLFSEPQPDIRRLVDLTALGWESLRVDADGLHVAATCTIAELSRVALSPDWRAGELIARCCHALLGSFKVLNAATVGGNICLALPAGPMTALAVALGGVALIWQPDGAERRLPVEHLVLGERHTALAPGEVLRSVILPVAGLRCRFALRQISLTPLGRSGALLIGLRGRDGSFALTLTASTRRPIRLDFAAMPSPAALAGRIETAVDIHGDPRWRRHVSLLLAAEIRDELATSA
jgi:CO/xanthine dehydrogenase FAD-binding subunit